MPLRVFGRLYHFPLAARTKSPSSTTSCGADAATGRGVGVGGARAGGGGDDDDDDTAAAVVEAPWALLLVLLRSLLVVVVALLLLLPMPLPRAVGLASDDPSASGFEAGSSVAEGVGGGADKVLPRLHRGHPRAPRPLISAGARHDAHLAHLVEDPMFPERFQSRDLPCLMGEVCLRLGDDRVNVGAASLEARRTVSPELLELVHASGRFALPVGLALQRHRGLTL